MNDFNAVLIDKLSSNTADGILRSETDGAYFYALSPLGSNLIEWFPFQKEDKVLQIGAAKGVFCPLAERVAAWDIFDPDLSELDLVEVRLKKSGFVDAPGEAYRGKVRILTELTGTSYTVLLIASWPGIEKLKQYLERYRGAQVLILAENADALKFLSGNPKEEGISYAGTAEMEALQEILPGSRRYYPLPSGRIAKEIFSDAVLPGPGDFRGIGIGYREGEAAVCDLEAVYSALVRKDPAALSLLAPAVLFVQSSRDLPDYIRYNRTRKAEYQTRTEVWKGKKVVKTALSAAADPHILAFAQHVEKIRQELPEGVGVAKPVIAENENGRAQAQFPFLGGVSLGKHLASRIKDGKAPEEAIEEILSRFPGDRCNLDCLFENYMLDANGNLTLIDYEWVMDRPVPEDFLRYRNLRYFYEENKQQLSAYAGLNGFLESFGISKEEARTLEAREQEFQSLVYGEDGAALEARYQKKGSGTSSVREIARAMASDEIRELKETLKKEREVERLSQQHIRNIEEINRVREEQLKQASAELDYLRKHRPLWLRAKQGLIRRIDAFAPADSGRRLVIKYIKGTLRHPTVYIKRYLTAEGHNYIRGNFAIRGEFAEGGILKLPTLQEGQQPLVSIVIPAYNQVGYTYACIRSILMHTDAAATPYEVILADDASTDATANLSDWVENLIINRTSGNLGFLKNCNEAAEKARGQYIFFLNNDTKVTDGWLSSLVALMEQDSEIGMCGSKLIYPDGRLQEAGGIIWSDASGWNYGRMDDPAKCCYNYVKEVDYISGAAILIRTELWKEIGGFDERYAPAYCEDSDLAFEVRKHGKKVVLQPASVVIHFEGISNGTDVNGTGLKRYQLENQKKFKEKWQQELKEQSVNTGDPNPFAARERSQKKKTILIIDHYVPHWDKDAGSKTTFQYIRMFLKKGYNVKFLGDNFEAEQPYTGILEQMGVEVLYGTDMRESIFDWIEKNREFIHIAYLNRPHISVKYLDFLKEHTQVRCIYYGHDLHYLRLHREYELSGSVRRLRESEYWKGLEYQVMESADMVYYPSQAEIDEIHTRNPEIPAKAIVAYIYDKDEDKLPGTDTLSRQISESSGFLFVGGFAHQPNEDGVLWFAESIWPQIREKLPEAEFMIAGSHPTERITALDGAGGIRVLGFVSDERLAELYETCRIVVVPLRYGAGVKGKVIEALDKNAAIVTTSVGAEGIPEAETVMKIADSEAEFAEAAAGLYMDEKKLLAMKQADAPFIAKHYSTEAAWEIIREDFT